MRLRPVRHTPAVLLGAIALGAAACGASHAQPPAPPVLPAAAVSYLPSAHHRLTAAGLAREIRRPALTAELSHWGFRAAAERSFQGESHRLTVVDSRTFQFSSPAGARSFVSFVRGHAAVYLGAYPTVRPFTSAGRTGWTFRAQSCACPGATPLWLAVARAGARVTWLEINGPDATVGTLQALAALAP
ncbi:MAG TPA: hypothetical protein VGL44_17185 [Gaiellales bacterium]|jgi:hypothetical protein